MYESDEEYSFVVLSRVNSFKKVRWKFLTVLINGENPEVVVRMKIFNIYLNHKYFSSQIAINKINFLCFSLIVSKRTACELWEEGELTLKEQSSMELTVINIKLLIRMDSGINRRVIKDGAEIGAVNHL